MLGRERERERDKNRLLLPAVSIACLLTVFALTQVVSASPIQWTTESGGNGHYYEVVDDFGISWSDAKTAAEAMTYLENPGYLVTITSAAENDFVTELMAGTIIGGWAGGYQPEGSPEPDGGWSWVTGETWTYTNWAGGEPNNNGDENALKIHSSDTGFEPRQWNDNAETYTGSYGYVIEYTPEPATLALLALGGVAMMARRRKKN